MFNSIRRAAAAVAGLAVVASSASFAQGREAPHSPVRIEIVAAPEPSAAGAGWLGIRFVVEPGWHIYWQNPGDSGGPPEVSWQLPAGLQAGPWQWPVPERIPFETLVNYGYHGDVVLPAKLTAAGGRLPAEPFTVKAQVKWLVCREICVPGKGEASLVVPAGARVPPATAERVRRALARVPRPAPRGWRLSGTADRDTFTLSVQTGSRETAAQFFPLVPGQVDPAAPTRASPTARGVDLVLRKSNYLESSVASLKGVIVLSGGRAYEIDVPLTQ